MAGWKEVQVGGRFHAAEPRHVPHAATAFDASKAASCMHRASQLRHAAHGIEDFATALRHGGARGWVTAFGDGGVDAANPTLVPTLLALADTETALARSKARPLSRPGSLDHAHAPLLARQSLDAATASGSWADGNRGHSAATA